jgi:uncharacterized membrane protein
MKQDIRWIIYIIIGIMFGIFDFYIEALVRQFLTYPLLFFVGGIWVIPPFIVAFYEVKKSGSKRRAIAASILTWVAGVIAYYAFYATRLAFDNSIISFDWADILLDAVLWGVAAAIGGATIGLLTAAIYKLISKNKIRSRDKEEAEDRNLP